MSSVSRGTSAQIPENPLTNSPRASTGRDSDRDLCWLPICHLIPQGEQKCQSVSDFRPISAERKMSARNSCEYTRIPCYNLRLASCFRISLCAPQHIVSSFICSMCFDSLQVDKPSRLLAVSLILSGKGFKFTMSLLLFALVENSVFIGNSYENERKLHQF